MKQSYVCSCDIGADRWRRTGVLTYVRVKKKVTFKISIWSVYGTTFSYHTVHNTLATNNQHRTLVVDGKQTLTTHTDYLNKYPSTLQTMCYNFTGTARQESIVQVLSSLPRYFPNILRRFQKISTLPEFQPIFTNSVSGSPKNIECGQVDEAGDEGPSHL